MLRTTSRIALTIATFSLIILMSMGACKESPQQAGANQGSQSESAGQDPSTARRVAPADSQRSRGLTAAVEFDFDAEYPEVSGLAQSEPALYENLIAFATTVSQPQLITTEQQYQSLTAMRDAQIIPALESKILNEDIQDFDRMSRLEDELNRLGMTLMTAEGMILELGKAELLPEVVAQVASPAFKAYLDFQNASSNAHSGEYPYMDMGPWQELVVSGERLRAMPDNEPYWSEIQEEFEGALMAVADIHLVKSSNAREGEGTPLVGSINTDFYPYAAEIESLKDFGQRYPESTIGKTVQRIALNPSTMGEASENLYVILIEWIEEEEAAQRKVMRYLSDGEDIPHYLPVVRGNGKVQYAVSYRFFEDADKADAALEEIQKTHPEAQLIFCSIKGEKLYQLGPG